MYTNGDNKKVMLKLRIWKNFRSIYISIIKNIYIYIYMQTVRTHVVRDSFSQLSLLNFSII